MWKEAQAEDFYEYLRNLLYRSCDEFILLFSEDHDYICDNLELLMKLDDMYDGSHDNILNDIDNYILSGKDICDCMDMLKRAYLIN
ncbi:hypothetical protein ACMSFO_00050 [Bacteroides thetaiotaomicron]|uniref:hypothetical protein n=1 Tax=Bacteroides thetaiotaomicron TaxID=818 RepID=UPI0039C23043